MRSFFEYLKQVKESNLPKWIVEYLDIKSAPLVVKYSTLFIILVGRPCLYVLVGYKGLMQCLAALG